MYNAKFEKNTNWLQLLMSYEFWAVLEKNVMKCVNFCCKIQQKTQKQRVSARVLGTISTNKLKNCDKQSNLINCS